MNPLARRETLAIAAAVFVSPLETILPKPARSSLTTQELDYVLRDVLPGMGRLFSERDARAQAFWSQFALTTTPSARNSGNSRQASPTQARCHTTQGEIREVWARDGTLY